VRLLARLFPRSWRERYGDEINDHLARSPHPVRDRLDLLTALVPAWVDDQHGRFPMSISRAHARIAAAALGAAGVVTTALAASQLQDGMTELGRHWWSAAAVLPLAAAAGFLGLGERVARRPHRP
jgi:acetyl esterase/lipase